MLALCLTLSGVVLIVALIASCARQGLPADARHEAAAGRLGRFTVSAAPGIPRQAAVSPADEHLHGKASGWSIPGRRSALPGSDGQFNRGYCLGGGHLHIPSSPPEQKRTLLSGQKVSFFFNVETIADAIGASGPVPLALQIFDHTSTTVAEDILTHDWSAFADQARATRAAVAVDSTGGV